MTQKTFNKEWGIIEGALDSDGCLSCSLNNKRELRPEVTITQRADAQMNEKLQAPLTPKPQLTKSSGNLRWNSQHTIENVLTNKANTLYGNRGRDRLIMLAIFNIRKQRKGRSFSVEQKQQIIDLRFQLHVGATRAKALTREEWEERWNVPVYSSLGAAKSIIDRINVKHLFRLLKIYKAMKAKTLVVNPYYVVGLVLGDGSFFISYGQFRIIPGFTIAMDVWSRFSILVAGYALTGEIETVINPKNNSYRLAFVSYGKNKQYVIPFFTKHPLLTGKKQAEFDLWSSMITEIDKLKQQKVLFSQQEVQRVLTIIRATYYMNPTPRERKYSLDEYCQLITPLLEQGKVKFY